MGVTPKGSIVLPSETRLAWGAALACWKPLTQDPGFKRMAARLWEWPSETSFKDRDRDRECRCFVLLTVIRCLIDHIFTEERVPKSQRIEVHASLNPCALQMRRPPSMPTFDNWMQYRAATQGEHDFWNLVPVHTQVSLGSYRFFRCQLRRFMGIINFSIPGTNEVRNASLVFFTNRQPFFGRSCPPSISFSNLSSLIPHLSHSPADSVPTCSLATVHAD